MPQDANDDRPKPRLIPGKGASHMAGVSLATWGRLRAADKTPSPVRLGGRVLWRVEELESWIAAGCPDGKTWRARRGAD